MGGRGREGGGLCEKKDKDASKREEVQVYAYGLKIFPFVHPSSAPWR